MALRTWGFEAEPKSEPRRKRASNEPETRVGPGPEPKKRPEMTEPSLWIALGLPADSLVGAL